MRRIVIDIETRSCADLKKVGAYVYAGDPSTSITLFGYKIGDDVRVWLPAAEPLPRDLFDALADERVILVAHNSGFERTVLFGRPGRAIGLPDTLGASDRWSCTAARGAACGLPRDLAGMCRALSLSVQKDAEGHRLMLRMSKPRTVDPLTWWDDPDKVVRLGTYCIRDVEIEAVLDRKLPPLSGIEHAVWECTEKMNDRGIAVDQALLHRMIQLAEAARRDLDCQIADLTAGKVPRVSNHAALTRWLVAKGLEIKGSSKNIVQELMEDPNLDPEVCAVLEIRQSGGGSSSGKAAAMGRQLSDGRVRGALICAGAATGRWSSHGAQLQNLPRHDPQFNASWIIRDIAADASLAELADLHGPPMKLVSELLRPVLIAATGKVLVTADYAQIEARVLAWLAGQDDRLEVFRAYDAGTGPDAYRVTAARIYGVPLAEVTPAQRVIGKTADLALGYQGGRRAFVKMAFNFGLKITGERAEEVKIAWRAPHPFIQHFWWRLDAAMRECIVQPPGETFSVGRLAFRRNDHAVMLHLPSGRRLFYWQPSMKLGAEAKWGEQPHCWGLDSLTRQWTEYTIYGGMLAENVTQAAARDLLAAALVQLDAAALHPVLCVHDEAICETASENIAAITKIMTSIPPWADGLPVAVDVGAGPRYLKEK